MFGSCGHPAILSLVNADQLKRLLSERHLDVVDLAVADERLFVELWYERIATWGGELIADLGDAR